MTVRYPLQSGNWNDVGTWFGGVIPGSGDDVFTNGFNITINVASVTVNSLRNAAGTSPVTVSGGVYTISVACTLTVTGGILHAHHDSASAGALITTTTGAHAISITAPIIQAGNFPTVFGYAFQSIAGYTGALTINADGIYGGERGFGVRILGAGAVVVNADLYGVGDGGIGNGIGLRIDAAISSLTINGDLYGAPPGNNGGGSGGGMQSVSAIAIPTTTIVGSFYGTPNGYGAALSHNGTIDITAIDIIATAVTSLTLAGSGAATVRAITITSNGRQAPIANAGGLNRILRVSGSLLGGGVVPVATPFPGTFPISGRFNFIDGEPFALKMVDDSGYPTSGNPVIFRSGRGSGTAVTVPGNATEVVARSGGALFFLVAENANTVTLGMPPDLDELTDPDLLAAQLSYVFGSEEDELGWLTVTARGVQMVADSADVGSDPNHVPISGSVIFSPGLSKPVKRLSTNEILAIASAVAVFDINGELSFDGEEDIRLIAPLWSDLSNTTWRWTATFQPGPGQSWTSFAVSFTGIPGAIVNLGSLVG